MICKTCKKDLPLKKFSTVTFTYVRKNGTKKTYRSLRKSCNHCTFNKYQQSKPKLHSVKDNDSRLVAY